MSKFVFGISDDVVKECRMTMFIKEVNIPKLIVHARQIKEQKIKDKERDNK